MQRNRSSGSPNILFIMADQLAPQALPAYGHPLVQAPNIQRLAENGVVFENAYCNSPLCAPARYSLLSGQLPSVVGGYDNAAELPASTPTFLHYLRLQGYYTCLDGKQHFAGPDQLHGAEARLTTDIYPADFGWTPSWGDATERLSWHHNMDSVIEAGPAARTLQIDFDDDAEQRAVQAIHDLARYEERPFFLQVSFTHPHDPYATPPEYWDRYRHGNIDMPAVASLAFERHDPHSQRLYTNYRMGEYDISEAHVRNARHAYYGMISYVDDKVGRLLAALEATGLRDDTIVVFTGDHGDMLGERGLWYKMSFFEHSARVPLIVNAPRRFDPRRIAQPVSHVDLFPTLLEMTGDGVMPELAEPVAGDSLMPLLSGDEGCGRRPVLGEYMGEGTVAPVMMVRKGRYKYIGCEADPVQLYDLESDPHELENLAGSVAHGEVEADMQGEFTARWDAATLRRIGEAVALSQKRRRLVSAALARGEHSPWDYMPRDRSAARYIRNVGEALGDTDKRARLMA